MVTMCEPCVCPRCGPCTRTGSWCSTSSAPPATSSCSWWAEWSGNQSQVLRYCILGYYILRYCILRYFILGYYTLRYYILRYFILRYLELDSRDRDSGRFIPGHVISFVIFMSLDLDPIYPGPDTRHSVCRLSGQCVLVVVMIAHISPSVKTMRL